MYIAFVDMGNAAVDMALSIAVARQLALNLLLKAQ